MNVLSLFDGISGAQVALERAGIRVDNYFASEIDKYAIQITQKNYPNTIQLGSIENLDSWALPKIDLVIGGSPCQGFSLAGKMLNFDDPRSKLFFRFCDCLSKFKPKYFILENVRMKKEHEAIITNKIGVDPVAINSNLLSAQDRYRLYWSNINIVQPMDLGLKMKDIINGDWGNKDITDRYNSKVQGTLAYTKSRSNTRSLDRKSKTLTAVGQCIANSGATNIRIYNKYYKLSPIDCERLQTFPDNYTHGISNTQRYKALGNSFTVDVIAHILSSLKNA